MMKVSPCFVIDSSGCHRYERWNETNLTRADRIDRGIGWSSVSIAPGSRPQFVTFDFLIPKTVVEMRLLGRKRKDGVKNSDSFPRELLIERSDDLASWKKVERLNVPDHLSSFTCKKEFRTRFVRLTVQRSKARVEQKVFAQLCRVHFYEKSPRLTTNGISEKFTFAPQNWAPQTLKRGLLSGNNFELSNWSMNPGQSIPIHMHFGQQIWMNVSKVPVKIKSLNNDKLGELQPGKAFYVAAKTYVGFENNKRSAVYLLSCKEEVGRGGIWFTR